MAHIITIAVCQAAHGATFHLQARFILPTKTTSKAILIVV